MGKLKTLTKKIHKENIWISTLTIFLVLDVVFFFMNLQANHNIILNFVAIIMCSFALGLWIKINKRRKNNETNF